MRDNLSNPPDDLRDGPQEAAEFIPSVPSQPSRDQHDQNSAQQQDDQAGDDQRDQRQAEAEVAAALGSSEFDQKDVATATDAPDSAPQDTSTGAHS